MRIASVAAVGISVTTLFFIARFISERDDSRRSKSGGGDDATGTPDPSRTPTQNDLQPFRPGERLTISLNSEPATHYSDQSKNDAYRALSIRAAEGRGTYDSALSRAAFETAVQGALHRGVTPEAVTTFILHSAGAPDSSSARFSLRTNDDDDSVVERAIDEALASPPNGVGDLYFGVGEADTPGDPHARHIVVLMVRRAFTLDRTARRADLDTVWIATGELPAGFSNAHAKVLYPDSRLETATLGVDGGRFEIRVMTGTLAGQLSVGIDGIGAEGPGKLMQVTVEVGQPLPRELRLTIAEPDPEFASIAEAEAHAAALLGADRKAAGAPVLEIDTELAAIARAHSEDMVSGRFFAHQSPTTGLAGDRIHDAGYRSSGFAENLAKNDSVAEAETSLLLSVGHRANLLSHDFTHVGVGVARSIERGQTQWYVTQLFARKTVEIDSAELAADLYERVEDARRQKGHPPLVIDADLEEVAAGAARQTAAGDTEDIASKTGRRASDATRRSVSVSVQAINGADQFQLPKTIDEPSIETIGIGVAQSQTDPGGRIGIVLITGQPR